VTIYGRPVATRPPPKFGKFTYPFLQGYPASEI